MRFHLVLLALLLAAAYGLAAPAEKTAEGIEQVLRGARLGTAFGDFVDAHPEAVYSDAELRATPVSKEAPGALLVVHPQDPFLDLYSFSNFGFKEDTLYELVAVWSGEPDTVRAQCTQFIKAVMKRHGPDYTRKSIRVFPKSKEERPVAVFYWEDKDAATLAFYTPPYAYDPQAKATLTYAQFSKGDPFLTDIFTNIATTPEQHDQVWRDIDDIVKALK